MNLLEKAPEPKRSRIAWVHYVAVTGLVFSAIWGAKLWLTGIAPVNRAITVEERETVIAVLARLEDRFPAMRTWAHELREELAHEKIEVTVTSKVSETGLIWSVSNQVFVSSDFFESDSRQQEQSLVPLVAAIGESRSNRESPALARPDVTKQSNRH